MQKGDEEGCQFCSYCGAALRTEEETDEDETGEELWDGGETAAETDAAPMEAVAESEVVPEDGCFVTEEGREA